MWIKPSKLLNDLGSHFDFSWVDELGWVQNFFPNLDWFLELPRVGLRISQLFSFYVLDRVYLQHGLDKLSFNPLSVN